MLSRPDIQRRLLRLTITKQRSTHPPKDQALIDLMLADEAIFETVYQRALEEARSFGDETGMLVVAHDTTGTPIVNSLLDLLRWFSINGPTLLEIVRQISQLFGGTQEALRVVDEA